MAVNQRLPLEDHTIEELRVLYHVLKSLACQQINGDDLHDAFNTLIHMQRIVQLLDEVGEHIDYDQPGTHIGF